MFNTDVIKRMTIVAALSGVAVTAAVAQSSPGNTVKSPDPMSNSMSKTTLPRAASSAMAKAVPVIVTQQMPDQWLASQFKGTDVIGLDDKKIGDVDDVLFNKDGRVSAYVIGVGGILGVGEKKIAVEPASVEAVAATKQESPKLRLAMTKTDIEKAAAFQSYKPKDGIRVLGTDLLPHSGSSTPKTQ